MHPAKSVIFFTVMSGLGYGLVAWLGIAQLLGRTLPGVWPLALLTLALLAITAGLLSSTLHLGHPERAWRALSQWRTSWLSREGVLAVLAFLPLGLWWLGLAIGFPTTPFAALSALLALLTVFSTAMIYASLKAVPAWHGPGTVAAYLALALYTGGAVYLAAAGLAVPDPGAEGRAMALALVLALAAKAFYWRRSAARHGPGIAEATGIAGAPRLLEGPHTGQNYLMREMGFVIARRHSRTLRLFVLAALFALPFLALVAALEGVGARWVTVLAAVSILTGAFVERWLFFAEARHVQALYYGHDPAGASA
ncbi:MAG: dimethyl sulfoxide reductase anchor subunit family protein [Rubricella sp.]